MKIMVRLIAIMAVLVLGMAFGAGCSDDDNGTAVNSSSASTASSGGTASSEGTASSGGTASSTAGGVFTENMSLPLAVRDYYRSAYGKTGAELKAALNSIIKSGHTRKSYDDIWDVMDDADKWNGKVILMYTGHEHNPGVRYPTWNREHTWPKSHGFPGTSQYGYTDAHHLRPTDCGVNSTRGNKDFDNGGSPVSAAPGCYTDTDSFEPRDAVKGDCARMIFYMAVRYEGDDGSMPDLRIVNQTGTSGATLGKLTTLLQWSIDDLVDDRERHRNERIYVQWQHNRNPFIDYPEAVELIWGTPASFTTY